MADCLSRRSILFGVLGAGLAACDDDGGNQVLPKKKGIYQGKKDTPLTDEQVEALRDRAQRQLF